MYTLPCVAEILIYQNKTMVGKMTSMVAPIEYKPVFELKVLHTQTLLMCKIEST